MICIDLGSNTLRACLMNDELEVVQAYEKIVGSARNLSDKGLSNQAKKRIYDALVQLKSRFDFDSNLHIAVATEAFRLAKNAKDFFEFISSDLGINFNIISGFLEAKLTKLGVENRAKKLGVNIEKSLLIDLGGASTEISFGDNFASFKFGIVRFWQECDFDIKDSDKFAKFAKIKTNEAVKFIDGFKFENIILTSGVPTSVAALKLGLKYDDYDARLINGMVLDMNDFYDARRILCAAKDPDLLVGDDRVELVIAGVWLMSSMISKFKVPFIVIDDGLREGIGVGAKLKLLNLKE